MLQLGFSPSHFSFRFLHIMHARRFGFGTVEFPPDPPSVAASPLGSETMIVSGGVPDEDDISVDCCAKGSGSGSFRVCPISVPMYQTVPEMIVLGRQNSSLELGERAVGVDSRCFSGFAPVLRILRMVRRRCARDNEDGTIRDD